MEKANKDSWKIQPMPEEVAEISYSAEFSTSEFEKISLGLVPEDMEDKWFMFLEGNTLYIQRSWTGHCIYQVEFDRDVERYWISRTLVNRNQEQYGQTDDEYAFLQSYGMPRNCYQ